jgi:phage-related minor tail protein
MANKSVGLLTIAFGADLRGFERAMKKAQRTVKRFGISMQRTGQNLTRNITLPVIGLGAAAIKTFANFEQSMLKVKAVSGATDAEFKKLTETAKQLGSSTMFTASQVADLQFELSKLGFSADEINLSTESILALSQATSHDLAESGAIVASTLKSFNKEANEASKVADIMAFASSNSAMEMEKFANAMPIVGATANTVGTSLEDLTAHMMVLADRGIQASSMGTHLRKIFAELEIRGLTLEEALNRINRSSNKTALATEFFGKRAFNTAIILADNIEKQKQYSKQLHNSEGAAKSMAEIMDSGT